MPVWDGLQNILQSRFLTWAGLQAGLAVQSGSPTVFAISREPSGAGIS